MKLTLQGRQAGHPEEGRSPGGGDSPSRPPAACFAFMDALPTPCFRPAYWTLHAFYFLSLPADLSPRSLPSTHSSPTCLTLRFSAHGNLFQCHSGGFHFLQGFALGCVNIQALLAAQKPHSRRTPYVGRCPGGVGMGLPHRAVCAAQSLQNCNSKQDAPRVPPNFTSKHA